MEEDCDCVGLCKASDKSGAESCLRNCSPVIESVVDTVGEKSKTKKKKKSCSADSNWKTPLLPDNIHDSTKSNWSASMNPENGSTVEYNATAFDSCCAPINLQQDASSQYQSSASVSTEDLENEILFSADDREFDFLKVPLLPRSSSLKSRKTPHAPGTPTHRKSVRFADALGLDLELVRHILYPDEPPTVPITAGQFLQYAERVDVISYWRVCFPHPATSENLTQRVLRNKVSLESCSINNSNRRVYGTVRVANAAYEKSVQVRYTINGWLTSDDVQATYIEHSNDLITDRFSFELKIPEHLVARSRLEFAVNFSAANQTFWDNNFSRNYALECVDYNVV